MQYAIYTDGSYQSSINAGGYAVIIVNNKDELVEKLYFGYRNTTNNRNELRGVITALQWLSEKDSADIYSDSQYVLDNIERAKKWLAEDDLTKKNLDLWLELLEALEGKHVVFHWVKGHSNNKYNELADKFAVHAAQALNLPNDLQ